MDLVFTLGGRLQSLDWTGGLDRWTGLDWTGLDWNGLDSTRLKVSATILQLLESGYCLLISVTSLSLVYYCQALRVCTARDRSKFTCIYNETGCVVGLGTRLSTGMEHACSKVQSCISKRLLLKATGLAPRILVEESCLEVSLYMHVTFDQSLAVRTRRVWLYGKTE